MKKNQKNGNVTMEDLARMMAEGLAEVGEKITDAKDEIKTELKNEIGDFKLEVNNRFNRLENSFEKSEDEHFAGAFSVKSQRIPKWRKLPSRRA